MAELLRRERSARLWKGLSDLSPKLKEALVLKYVEGLSHEAAAELLGIPVGTVKSRIAAGLARLRLFLGVSEPAERSHP